MRTTTVGTRLTPAELAQLEHYAGQTTADKLRTAIGAPASPLPAFDFVAEMNAAPIPIVGSATPDADLAEKLELFIAASGTGLQLSNAAANLSAHDVLGGILRNSAERSQNYVSAAALNPTSNFGPFIDPAVRAMMEISEFFSLEGDIWAALTVPLEVGFQDFDFPTGDQGAIREVRSYLEDDLQMHDRLAEIFLNRQVYGNCLVIEAGDGAAPDDLILPNPKNIGIGQAGPLASIGYAYEPATPAEAAALWQDRPAFFYQSVTRNINEKETPVNSFPLDPARVKHFHTLKHAHNLYGIPPLARAARSIDTRRYLEEMVRATIEGLRNQLWVFTVDNPMSGEVPALSALLASTRAARTGFIAWRGGLKVEQHVPGSIDALLGMDAHWEFTLRVYRQLGITIRFVAGENPNRSGSSDAETDVKVGLNKMMYGRKPFERYLQSLVDRKLGSPKSLDKTNTRPSVRLKDIELVTAERIKSYLTPLMDRGLPSLRTAMTVAGLNYDDEIAQHKEDKPLRDMIVPYTAFAQSGPSGTVQHTDPGRPGGVAESSARVPKGEGKQSVKASVEDDYYIALMALWEVFVVKVQEPALSYPEQEKQTAAFILGLLALGGTHRRDAYLAGYDAAGGIGAPAEMRLQAVMAWDVTNLEAFQAEILSRLQMGADITGLGRRAGWYASQGYRIAFTTGKIDAMAEAGWTGWRRLLRPYASASGPCAWCQADARVIHSTAEMFTDHPSGVCGMVMLQFYHSGTPGPVVNIPPQIAEGGDL
jgi:hypothetical protein